MVTTLIIIKPGFLSESNVILDYFYNMSYSLKQEKTTKLTREQCETIWGDIHQEEIDGHFRPGYFDDYCNYVMSDNVYCAVIESNDNDYNEITIAKRDLRKKYNVHGFMDLLHTSDSNEDAEIEISCIFGNK
jgi:nucleoside diphosphate kinase